MPSEDQRLLRRTAFDAIPDQYDEARPMYPEALLAELMELTGVGPGKTILELGPGTGQLTLPLAATGATVLALELGCELAGFLRRRTKDRSNVEVVAADFDKWDGGGRKFDCVMAAVARLFDQWFPSGVRQTDLYDLTVALAEGNDSLE